MIAKSDTVNHRPRKKVPAAPKRPTYAPQKAEMQSAPLWTPYQDRVLELENIVAGLREQISDLTADLSEARFGRNHFGELFEQAPAGYLVHDGAGYIFDANQPASALLGYKALRAGDVSLAQFVIKADVPAWLKHIRHCVHYQQFCTVELTLCPRGAAPVPVRLLTQPAFNPNGRHASRYHTLLLDITVRRATEAALAQSQQDYRQLIDTIEGIVWEADARTFDITFVSQFAERLLGYPITEWRRPGFWENRIYVEDRERVANQIARAIARKADLKIEYRVLNAARQVVWLHDSITVAEREGRLKLLGVALDVTEPHQAQDQLRAAQNSLELRVAERTSELQRTIGELEAFSYSISHDLRSPLRSMIGFADLALEDAGPNLDANLQDLLHRISQSAHRADRLVQDLLSYSRVSRANTRLGPIDLEKLLREILEQNLDFHPSRAKVQVHSPLLPVLGHEVSLSQILVNLLSNAIKFVAPGTFPVVTVRTERVNGHVRLWVEDNGIGIEPFNLGRIFGIFERIHPSHKYEGTGIGLAIVRKGVERMGGRVGVESEPGKGSHFWLELKGVHSP